MHITAAPISHDTFCANLQERQLRTSGSGYRGGVNPCPHVHLWSLERSRVGCPSRMGLPQYFLPALHVLAELRWPAYIHAEERDA